MMMRRRGFLVGLAVALALAGVWTSEARAQEPVVYAVLFYSPTCPHCHDVINNVLPPLREEYGEQLQILYIDVSQQGGGALFSAACEALSQPGDRCGYVPALVIGETMLVGSGDIPARLPALIEAGLAAGGIDLPPIPGLREVYEAATVEDSAGAESSDVSVAYTEMTWQERFEQDPLGNGLAVGVLGVLVVGFVAHLQRGVRVLKAPAQRAEKTSARGRTVLLALAIATAAIAATLAFEGGGLDAPTLLAAIVTLGLIAVIVGIARARRLSRRNGYTLPAWLLPVIAALGLIVAGYLAFVEVSENDAVCGAVGDCNTVQQSSYAELFGVLPIGVLGMIGYVAILTAWLVSRSANERTATWGSAALLGFALLGTAFSIYLTFLEPFVIGATCAWCLTSAMLMILLLCLHAPAGWGALHRLTAGAGSSAPHARSRRPA